MFKIISLNAFFVFLSFVVSCGDRPVREEKPDNIIVGSWQHIYDVEGFDKNCNPNTDCKCSDVFNFYSGNTFERNLQCEYKKGSFEFRGDEILLNYVSANPQVFQYMLNSDRFQLVKNNTVHTYVRKPFSSRAVNY